MPSGSKKTRVLIVDDSSVVRKLIGDALKADPDIEVVGGAADPYAAREMIRLHNPDLLTLDIEMPHMDGLTFLGKLMEHHPMPVIVVSSLTQTGSAATLTALRLGAIDVLAKPGNPAEIARLAAELRDRIRHLRQTSCRADRATALAAASAATPAAPPVGLDARKAHGLVVIGGSTGGTQALEAVLMRMPADLPPTLVVQHMPPVFTKAFASRLDSVCPMRVVESTGQEALERGTVYIAPGGHHLAVERRGVQLRTVLRADPPVHHQRPAVDVLFHSAVGLKGLPIVGVLLTGMGADGADGMVALKRAGAETIAQDERSCVVFGMPKEAIARGGASHVSALLEIPSQIFKCFDRLSRRRP
jgi:two-component system chemotaxis response regulator CheB